MLKKAISAGVQAAFACPELSELEKNTWAFSTQTSSEVVSGVREEAVRYNPTRCAPPHPRPAGTDSVPRAAPASWETGLAMGVAGSGPALGTGDGRTDGRTEAAGLREEV